MTTEIAVRERPIIFSGAMVRALLDGSKTQTRRVVTNLNPTFVAANPTGEQIANAARRPYGQPGDRLWVREAWYDDLSLVREVGDTSRDKLYFRADGGAMQARRVWRSPIHMPRWASRLTLEITDVRVERLQAIGYADALAEGMVAEQMRAVDFSEHGDPVAAYSFLWDKLNARKGYSWESNCWVWALSFRVFPQAGEAA